MRSEEIDEILENIPNKINNWILGIVVFIVVVLVSLSCIIDYPDIIKAEVRIIAQNQPYKIVSQSNGQVVFLFDSNNPYIIQDTDIAYIINSANYESVQLLKTKIVKLIHNNYSDSILNDFNNQLIENLGELSSVYYLFSNVTTQYNREKNDSLFAIEIKFLRQKLKDIIEQIDINDKILENTKTGLDIINKKLLTDSILMTEKAILPNQFEESKLYQLNTERSYLKLIAEKENLISSVKALEFELNKKIIEKNRLLKELREKIIENSQRLLSEIIRWDNLYVLKSPINGNLEINGFIENNQFVEKGRELFKVLPTKNNIKGQMFIPSVGAGEVKIGAPLHIHLMTILL